MQSDCVASAEGTKVWSAGHDVRELPTNGRDPLTYDDPLRRVVRALRESAIPIIAMVEGGVWGGACEVAMNCDIVIAAEGATFAITPAKLGRSLRYRGYAEFHAVGELADYQGNAIYSPTDAG